MSLKINTVSVLGGSEKSNLEKLLQIYFPPFFSIQVKIYLKRKWENAQLDNYHTYLFSQH